MNSIHSACSFYDLFFSHFKNQFLFQPALNPVQEHSLQVTPFTPADVTRNVQPTTASKLTCRLTEHDISECDYVSAAVIQHWGQLFLMVVDPSEMSQFTLHGFY